MLKCARNVLIRDPELGINLCELCAAMSRKLFFNQNNAKSDIKKTINAVFCLFVLLGRVYN